MAERVRRVLGLTLDSKSPIFEPVNAGSSLTFAAAGGGKTTCVALPIIQSLLADRSRALFINDVKKGEIAAQITPLCEKYGRKFAVVDEFCELGEDFPYRISLNPFGAAVDAHAAGNQDLPFVIEAILLALIDEPKDDHKNFYWRESPREILGLGLSILLEHNPRLATPGGLHTLLSDPETWTAALEIEAEEGESVLKAAARQMLDMRENNPEHYSQHMRAALTALKIFASGPLHTAGANPAHTHEQLIRDGWVVCFVNPVRHAGRLGAFFALHFNALMSAQLSGAIGRADYVLDEYCAAPLRVMIDRITVFRAFGARVHFITQSRQDSVRQYGEKETALLEENCTIKKFLKFTNFEEAERVSKAMGETLNVSKGLGTNSDKNAYSENHSTGKDRLFTADELMRLPEDEQILHVADVGWIHCKKIRQNQIAPTCFDLGDNPLEGARLPPDPKVHLPIEPVEAP